MKTLNDVRAQLAAGAFEFSEHAFIRAVERNVSEEEIKETGAEAVIVEEYLDDKYGPSMLILGFTLMGRPLHLQVSLADTPLVKIVTLYEPDSDEWWGHTQRR
ncbi:MAG: DUF4258 domain-containing protein [Chloroflexi bacterium]|nr:DUF4258 domain-containing protein [Chloroflexota bacterium]